MAGGLKSAAARSHLRANAGVSSVFLQSYCPATQGISLQQLIPTKLPIKVPFKVHNVTLVTIAWGGTHLALAECVFYLHETTPEKVKCVFYHTARGTRAMPPTHYWRRPWHSKSHKIDYEATCMQTNCLRTRPNHNNWVKDAEKCPKKSPKV